MILHKKLLSIAALILLCSATKIFATGAGIQTGITPGFLINEDSIRFEQSTGKITGTIKLGRLPIAAGLGLETGMIYSDFACGLYGYADYNIKELQIENTWNFYTGFGAEGCLMTKGFSSWVASAGARFFVGMNWLFWDNYLELYVQQNIVPTIVKPLSSDSNGDFMLKFPVESGIRIHF